MSAELLVEFVSQVVDLSPLELVDGDALPSLTGAHESRIHQLQYGALTERMPDHLGASPLFAEQAL